MTTELVELADRLADAIDTNMMDGTARRTLHGLTTELRALASRAGGSDALDAARYRWLRDSDSSIDTIFIELPNYEGFTMITGADLDAAIDAAIAAAPEPVAVVMPTGGGSDGGC